MGDSDIKADGQIMRVWNVRIVDSHVIIVSIRLKYCSLIHNVGFFLKYVVCGNDLVYK